MWNDGPTEAFKTKHRKELSPETEMGKQLVELGGRLRKDEKVKEMAANSWALSESALTAKMETFTTAMNSYAAANGYGDVVAMKWPGT
jgi:hypothetical protein